jgi:hypothetical protein
MMRDHQRVIPGTTPGKTTGMPNNLPDRVPYRWKKSPGPLHGHACPVCGGKVRPCAVMKDMAVCLGRCRTLVELT